MAEKPREIKLSLLENGIDFVRSGITHFFSSDEPDPRDYKYAVLHIFSGTLLILKERLSRAHPSLIWVKVENQNLVGSPTVDFKLAVLRLENNASVKIEKKDLKVLTAAQKLRNRLEHYDIHLNLEDTQQIIGGITGFLYNFMREELNESLEKYLPEDVWMRIQEIEEIAEARNAEFYKEWLARAAKYVELSEEDLESLREESVYHPKHNPDASELVYCEQCGSESVVQVEPDIAICTVSDCRETYIAGNCLKCGNVTLDGDDICEFCWKCILDE